MLSGPKLWLLHFVKVNVNSCMVIGLFNWIWSVWLISIFFVMTSFYHFCFVNQNTIIFILIFNNYKINIFRNCSNSRVQAIVEISICNNYPISKSRVQCLFQITRLYPYSTQRNIKIYREYVSCREWSEHPTQQCRPIDYDNTYISCSITVDVDIAVIFNRVSYHLYKRVLDGSKSLILHVRYDNPISNPLSKISNQINSGRASAGRSMSLPRPTTG